MSSTASTAIIGIVLGGWLLAGVWSLWSGLSMRRRAERSLRQTARLGRLLDTAPAVPMIVRIDGRADAPDRLKRWLGIAREVTHFSDLSSEVGPGGIEPGTLSALQNEVRAAQRSGKSFECSVKVADSDRALCLIGGLADSQIYSNGAALLWFFDASERERLFDRLRGEAEQARAAFEALAGLIEAAPMPMWYRGPDLRLNLVNRAYSKAVGADSAEAVVDEQNELIESIEGLSASAAAGQAREKDVPVERSVATTIGGERRQVRVVDVPLGESGVAGYAIDIQELADTRGEHRRFVAAQRDMLDNMSSAVVQFGADRSVEFSNLPFHRLFAIEEAWLSEGPDFARLFDRMRDKGKLPEVRDFPEWRGEREEWFRAAAPAEENWLLPDNTHLRVLAQPTPDGGLLLIFEDRTEQAQLASARDTLLRVRTATLNNLFEGIAVFAADGRLNLWNERFAEIWAIEEERLGTHPHIDALMSQVAERLAKPSQIGMMREMIHAATEKRVRKNGRMGFADGRHFEFSTMPLPDGNALFAMLDISDSQRIERALRERNEALTEADAIKARFLGNMSYEFRTPLTSIQGFAEMMEAGMAGPLSEQGADYVRAILDSVERLSGQINTVLDLSQGEAGALPIVKQPLGLESFMADVATRHADDAKAMGVSLRCEVEKSAGHIAADAKRLDQALDHIIANALRFAGEGGDVLLYADGERNDARIVVSDDGPGMDAHEQARALDRFADGEGKEKEREGGLGLPLARQLVEAHGGTIELLSEHGAGTMITLRLPRK